MGVPHGAPCTPINRPVTANCPPDSYLCVGMLAPLLHSAPLPNPLDSSLWKLTDFNFIHFFPSLSKFVSLFSRNYWTWDRWSVGVFLQGISFGKFSRSPHVKHLWCLNIWQDSVCLCSGLSQDIGKTFGFRFTLLGSHKTMINQQENRWLCILSEGIWNKL